MNVEVEIRLGKVIVSMLPGVVDSTLVGSAAYLNNPKDIDFLILLQPEYDLIQYKDGLLTRLWEDCSNQDYLGMGSTWFSVRQDNINLIITSDQKFFDGYKRATEVCKALRLESKSDRIAVHYIVRDGLTADEVQMNNVQALDPSIPKGFGLDNTFNLR
jgi:hypothetical protein